jgi:hypothetical protein
LLISDHCHTHITPLQPIWRLYLRLRYLGEDALNHFFRGIPVPEEIEIPRGPMRLCLPNTKELRTFEHKTLPVRALSETVEKTTGGILLHQRIESHPLRSGKVEELGPNRRSLVFHIIAST